jgi:riboflavin synthase
MQESLNKTNFSKKSIWDLFNIELCMKAGDRLDGHFVTGHIDTTGTITQKSFADDGSLLLTIWFDSKRNPLLLPKWSIAINGISLTVVDVHEDSFTVRLIPITQQDTNLWQAQPGDTVNLEFDMLGKYVLKSQWISI